MNKHEQIQLLAKVLEQGYYYTLNSSNPRQIEKVKVNTIAVFKDEIVVGEQEYDIINAVTANEYLMRRKDSTRTTIWFLTEEEAKKYIEILENSMNI